MIDSASLKFENRWFVMFEVKLKNEPKTYRVSRAKLELYELSQ